MTRATRGSRGFFTTVVLGPLILVAIWFQPRCFTTLVTLMFVVIYATQLIETAMFGPPAVRACCDVRPGPRARCHDRRRRCISGVRGVGPQLGGSHLGAVERGSRCGLQPHRHRHPHHRGLRVLHSPAGSIPETIRRPAPQHRSGRDRGATQGWKHDDRR